MPIPNYGSRDGLAERLDTWAERLSRDKRFPWEGTGLLKDLQAAAAVIQGKPVKKSSVTFDL